MQNQEYIVNFLMRLKGKIFKIMPMKENDDVTLPAYIDGLRVKIVGMSYNNDFLKNSDEYNSVVSIVSYMNFNEYSRELCKREVLKALDQIDIILNAIKGNDAYE